MEARVKVLGLENPRGTFPASVQYLPPFFRVPRVGRFRFLSRGGTGGTAERVVSPATPPPPPFLLGRDLWECREGRASGLALAAKFRGDFLRRCFFISAYPVSALGSASHHIASRKMKLLAGMLRLVGSGGGG